MNRARSFFTVYAAGFLIFLAPGASASTPRDEAIAKLKSQGISNELISLLERTHKPEERDKIVELNVLGFLGKADYSGHYSKRAVRKCLAFMRKHRRKLERMEKFYGVSREVITALLWVETKHGVLLGNHYVPNVYYSLLQSDHPDVMKSTLGALSTREPASVDTYRQKVIERSVLKAAWALGELKALDEILQTNEKALEMLRGSYAGAFGIPQFIPSSYVQWARPKIKTRKPNLFSMNDAIHSVAYYLRANGWSGGSSKKQKEALFHYNRSEGYVAVILKLAHALEIRQSERGISSTIEVPPEPAMTSEKKEN